MNAIFIILIIILILLWIAFYYQVKEHFSQNDELIQELRRDLALVHPAISKVNIYKGDKSYTINKKHVYLCMTDENGKYYDKNTLTFVLLHEMAHVITPEIGHTQLFHDNFESLLKKAEELGIYNPDIPMVKNYCNYGNE